MVRTCSHLFLKILLLWAGVFIMAGEVHAQEPVFSKLTTSHGLSHNTVYSIVQDRHGFMWFGTREGLNRYDGNSIVTY